MLKAGIFILALALLGIPACILDSKPDIRTTGTVRFIDLEGGFYGIIGDDGSKYDPVNLPNEFRQDSLRVKFKANIVENGVSVHMWGTVIEIQKIEKM